jgi:hypothetical protein
MKKILGSVVITLLLTIVINAEDNARGFYLGIGSGSMKYNDDGLASNDLDDKNNGTKLYLGFQFNKVVGVEYSYINYDKYNSYTISQEFTEHKIGANLGYSFMNAQLRPFINLGLALISRDITGGNVYQIDDGGLGLAYGLGIQYEPNFLNGVGIRIGYDSTLFAQKIGYETYNQSLNMTYIALQYKF